MYRDSSNEMSFENLKGRDHLGNLGTVVRKILKRIKEIVFGIMEWIHLT
jgi:hypothetical protein